MLGSSWDKEKVKGSGEDLKRENERERKGGHIFSLQGERSLVELVHSLVV